MTCPYKSIRQTSANTWEFVRHENKIMETKECVQSECPFENRCPVVFVKIHDSEISDALIEVIT